MKKKALLEQNYQQLSKDQPLHICLRVDKSISIAELTRQIMYVREVNIDQHQERTELILFQKNLGVIRGIFDANNKLT